MNLLTDLSGEPYVAESGDDFEVGDLRRVQDGSI